MRWLVAAVLLCGCDYLFNLEHVEPTHDGDISPGETCFGHNPRVICIDAQPATGLLELPSLIDTTQCEDYGGTLEIAESDSRVLCVIAGETLAANMVRVTGDHGLVLFATASIAISGALDAGSHPSGTGGTGPGAKMSGCTANGSAAAAFTAGGAGASYAALGGSGGAADLGPATPTSPTVPLDGIRAGCRGGNAADSLASSLGGQGGTGGGVVYLVANDAITIASSGALLVGGEGGQAGDSAAGGGGGGSGGTIVLDAPTVMSLGILCANGGGGGGAGNGGRGVDGCTNGIAQAAGGAAGVTGSMGGAGSLREIPPTGKTGMNAGDNRAGGGGGGAGGYIVIVSPNPNVDAQKTSPPAS